MKAGEINSIIPVDCRGCGNELVIGEDDFTGAGFYCVSCPDCGEEMPQTFFKTKFDQHVQDMQIKAIKDLNEIKESVRGKLIALSNELKKNGGLAC